MEYAYRGMKEAMETVTLTPDMGEEELHKKLLHIWRETASSIAAREEVQGDQTLRDAYRVVLDQAQSATADFRWLGQPELYYSPTKSGKKPSPLRHLLALPALAVFVAVFIWCDTNGQTTIRLLTALALAALLAYLGLTAWYGRRMEGQAGAMHAQQRVDLAKVRSSLEKIAMHVDAGAAGLYAQLRQRQEDQKADLDGIELVKRLLKLHYEGESLPESAMTEVRIYLSACHIEPLDYTPEREAMFTRLPSNGTKTIQPALVQHVRTVKDGEPCEEEVLLQTGIACVREES